MNSGSGFSNHSRRAKRRMLAAINAKNKKQRKAAYVDLLKISDKVLGYAQQAVDTNKSKTIDPMAFCLFGQIEHYADLTERVVSQTKRRVLLGQSVPAAEKVVSIFEEHTDIIVKDRRDTLFGHKICPTGGASNLILDCVIERGNPADVNLTIPMLERQKEIFGRYPLKVCFDGGFASKGNLKPAKDRKIKDYAEWLSTQFKKHRVSESEQRGILYYWSHKTDALSPEMVESGVAHQILIAFINHVKEEQRRLHSDCPDTMFIVTKAGIQELKKKDTNGLSILDLLKEIPNNVQINGSISYLSEELKLREALEPGARPEKDRFLFLKTLQENGILANGLLMEPIIIPFIPTFNYLAKLRNEINIKRMAIDILTTTIRSIAVTSQIIGWYSREGQKTLLESYLPQSAPIKKGNRRSVGIELQKRIYSGIVERSQAIGIETVYCRWVQKTTGLPKLKYDDYNSNGCMAYVSPTPKSIKNAIKEQLN